MDVSDVLQFLSGILPIILVIFGTGGIVVAYIQHRLQKVLNLEEKIREERKNAYIRVLEPFFLIFTKSPDIQAAINLMNSPEYKKAEFNFIFIGSDESISLFGDLIQYIFQSGDKNSPLSNISPDERTKEILRIFGNLNISIRKDFGNEKTKLRGRDTLKLFITDLYKYQDI